MKAVALEPHPLRSSCPLARIELRLADGSRRGVIVKQLARRARHAGPPGVHNSRREVEVYRSLLPDAQLGTPRFLGAAADLLFIEEVDGIPLWQSGEPAAWCSAAAWLGALHSRPAPRTGAALRYDERFYARWLPRARRFAPDASLDCLAGTHQWAVARLAAARRVFVHGDFYPSNVLVRPGGDICAVDFELAGAGAAALDLAALLTGLPDPLARDLLACYRERCPSVHSQDELDELILCARLHLAIRWLGWLEGWRAPDHQVFDWAREAHAAAGALGGPR